MTRRSSSAESAAGRWCARRSRACLLGSSSSWTGSARAAWASCTAALDVTLDRVVAVKALPRLLPDQAARLRREARAMATISHPNLALIYGAESWNGLPILIVEFLSGGTLSTRLRSGPLPIREALGFGIALAEVGGSPSRRGHSPPRRQAEQHRIHGGRDTEAPGFRTGAPAVASIGPGETDDGEACIRNRHDRRRDRRRGAARDRVGRRTGRGHAALPVPRGDLPGLDPDPTFDIWSICVVLFEAIAGANPVEDTTVAGTLHRITEL